MKCHTSYLGDGKWENVDLHVYKPKGDGTLFKDITRQTLFKGDGDLSTEIRYFEMKAGGYSTLERHQHVHKVLIGRGAGHCLVDDQVYEVKQFDFIEIPPMTWHQFRATTPEPLGFFCMVKCDRDRPLLPTEEDLKQLRATPVIATFIRI